MSVYVAESKRAPGKFCCALGLPYLSCASNAQLLDPRVFNLAKAFTSDEIDRLLQHLLKYLPSTEEEGDFSGEEDALDFTRES